MMTKITWPVVALVTVVLTAVVVMSAIHVDVRTITDVLILLGLGGIFGQVTGVNDKVNGRISQMLSMQARMTDIIAKSPPVVDSADKDT